MSWLEENKNAPVVTMVKGLGISVRNACHQQTAYVSQYDRSLNRCPSHPTLCLQDSVCGNYGKYHVIVAVTVRFSRPLLLMTFRL